MRALRFTDTVHLDPAVPIPGGGAEALVKVIAAGICNTDLEIIKGYAGFRGTIGHEFVGMVVNSPDHRLIGRRVAGEINAGCNHCELCRQGDPRHCVNRSVLGIKDRDGAFAEFLTLPDRNLIEVPDSLSDPEAVFIEPVAAACEILEQVKIEGESKVAVLGDGKLGQLVVRVLATTGCRLTVIGKHQHKLDLAAASGAAATVRLAGQSGPPSGPAMAIEILSATPEIQDSVHSFDVVIEASGSPSGLEIALALVRPRGIVVLKSTHHDRTSLNLSQVVVDEVTLVGSRCGRFEPAIHLLESRAVRVDDLISDSLPLDDWETALAAASDPASLKVILRM